MLLGVGRAGGGEATDSQWTVLYHNSLDSTKLDSQITNITYSTVPL